MLNSPQLLKLGSVSIILCFNHFLVARPEICKKIRWGSEYFEDKKKNLLRLIDL